MGRGRWQQTSRPVDDRLYQIQIPKGRITGLPTTSSGKPFQLWALGHLCTERHLAKRLKDNSFYPFTQQQPNGARGRRLGNRVLNRAKPGHGGRRPEQGGGGDLNGEAAET